MSPDADRPDEQGPGEQGQDPATAGAGGATPSAPTPPARSGGRQRRPRRAVRPGREQPVFSPTSDDVGVGWGERPEPDDGERLRREVPPHWGKD